jgi:uncharacterized protein YndB with AHSA1/START domain
MEDWTSFTRKVRINASPKLVFDAWTETQLMEEWFLKLCKIEDSNRSKIKEGDQVVWEWHNFPNRMVVDIKSYTERKNLVFTFGIEMEVDIQIQREGDWILLVLKQYNIPVDDASKMNFYVGCSRAWSTWMLNLKAFLEMGVSLHDTQLGDREDLFDFINT